VEQAPGTRLHRRSLEELVDYPTCDWCGICEHCPDHDNPDAPCNCLEYMCCQWENYIGTDIHGETITCECICHVEDEWGLGCGAVDASDLDACGDCDDCNS